MNYYENLILLKLKEDVRKDLFEQLKIMNTEIEEIIDQYFDTHKIEYVNTVQKYNIKESKTHIYRDRKNYKLSEDRCIARVWNEGMGGQCACKAKYDKFCKRHKDKGGYDWCFGTIDRPRPHNPRNHKGKIHIWLTEDE